MKLRSSGRSLAGAPLGSSTMKTLLVLLGAVTVFGAAVTPANAHYYYHGHRYPYHYHGHYYHYHHHGHYYNHRGCHPGPYGPVCNYW